MTQFPHLILQKKTLTEMHLKLLCNYWKHVVCFDNQPQKKKKYSVEVTYQISEQDEAQKKKCSLTHTVKLHFNHLVTILHNFFYTFT